MQPEISAAADQSSNLNNGNNSSNSNEITDRPDDSRDSIMSQFMPAQVKRVHNIHVCVCMFVLIMLQV